MYSLHQQSAATKRTILDRDGTCLLVSNNNSITTLQQEPVLQLETNITNIIKKDQYLFIESFSAEDGLEQTEVFDLLKKEMVILPGLERIMLRNGFSGDHCVALYYDQDYNTKAGVLTVGQEGKARLNKVNSAFEINAFKITGDILVLSDKFTLHLYKLNEQDPFASISLESLPGWEDVAGNVMPAELAAVIGLYQDIQWLHIKQFYLLGIEVSTGKIIYTLFLPDLLSLPATGSWQNKISIGDLHLDEATGIIRSLAYWRYWEIDLHTLKGNIRADFGHPGKEQAHAWSIHKSWYFPGEQYLYFTGKRQQQSFDTAVGIFDTETATVVWYDEPFPPKGGANFIPLLQHNEQYMAVQDSEGNAWIYKRL